MRAFIFDLDGTLLDSMGVWQQVDVDFLRKYGREPFPSLRDDIAVMQVEECAAYFRRVYELPLTEDEIMAEWREMVAEAYRDRIQPKPGATAFVRRCSAAGVPMCVATGSSRPDAEAALTRLGMLDSFAFLLTSGEVGRGKDRPDLYLRCAERLGRTPAECVVVEDVLTACRTARAAGFAVWGVYEPRASHEWEAIQAVAERTLYHFDEAPMPSGSSRGHTAVAIE